MNKAEIKQKKGKALPKKLTRAILPLDLTELLSELKNQIIAQEYHYPYWLMPDYPNDLIPREVRVVLLHWFESECLQKPTKRKGLVIYSDRDQGKTSFLKFVASGDVHDSQEKAYIVRQSFAGFQFPKGQTGRKNIIILDDLDNPEKKNTEPMLQFDLTDTEEFKDTIPRAITAQSEERMGPLVNQIKTLFTGEKGTTINGKYMNTEAPSGIPTAFLTNDPYQLYLFQSKTFRENCYVIELMDGQSLLEPSYQKTIIPFQSETFRVSPSLDRIESFYRNPLSRKENEITLLLKKII